MSRSSTIPSETNDEASTTSTNGTGASKPSVELFDDAECDRRFPVADYVQEFEFAQFIDFVYSPPASPQANNEPLVPRLGSEANGVPLILSRKQDIVRGILRAATTGQSLVNVMDGLPVGLLTASADLANQALDPSSMPAVTTVNDRTLRNFASTQRIKLGTSNASVTLAPRQLARLLSGDVVRVVDSELAVHEIRPSSQLRAALVIQNNTNIAATGNRDITVRAPQMERSEPSYEYRLRLAGVIPWRQKWKLLGYSRGKLLHSLTLAPQEETTIELFTWDRSKRALEQASQTDIERAYDLESKTQDTQDVLAEMTSGSEFNREAGIGFVASYGASEQTYVKLEGQGKLSAKDSATRVAKTSVKRLTEMTLKASTRVKTSRSSKISESAETGREDRVTRKIKNPNMCRTLSLDYFELMVTYNVETTPNTDGVVLCVMLRNPFANPESAIHVAMFKNEHLRIYESILRPFLLSPDLLDGFAAARMLRARDFSKAIACETYDCKKDEPEKNKGENKESPVPDPNAWKKLPAWEAAFTRIMRLAEVSVALFNVSPDPMMQAWDDADGKGESPAESDVLNSRRWLYGQLLAKQMPEFQQALEALKNYHGNDFATADHDSLRAAARRVDTVAPAASGGGSAAILNMIKQSQGNLIYPILESVIKPYVNKPYEFEWYSMTLMLRNVHSPEDAGLPLSSFFSVRQNRRMK
jgi:hypothetical protein